MNNKNINETQIFELFNIFIEYYNKIKTFSINNKIKIRMPNFQEGLSENIIRLFIKNYENINCECSKTGDLIKQNNIKVEVKCFSSIGPTSFGPTEKWDEIYFLDATEFNKNFFKIFKCELSNNSITWNNIQINKNQTFLDMCNQRKRTRLSFSSIKTQLKNNIIKIYEGNLENIIKTNKN